MNQEPIGKELVFCYNCQWPIRIIDVQEGTRGIPSDQSTREAAGALIPTTGGFELVYLSVLEKTEDDNYLSGFYTLAFLNLLLLALKSSDTLDIMPDAFHMPPEKQLVDWVKMSILADRDVTAIMTLVNQKSKYLSPPVAKFDIEQVCKCQCYITDGTPRQGISYQVTCDCCSDQIHQQCLQIVHLGLTQQHLLLAFLNPPPGVSRVKYFIH